MLQLIYGRAGSGKTEALLFEIVRRMDAGEGKMLLIVPETASHDAERRLAQRAGDRASLYCEVLTFRRLAQRVFAERGGLALPLPDDASRILLLHEAYGNVQSLLRSYGRRSRPQELLRGLLDVLDECESCRIDPPALLEASRACGEPLAAKLSDLALLYAEYLACAKHRLPDPRDALARVADALTDGAFLKSRSLFLDGFDGFTPGEREILELFCRHCGYIAGAFTCGSPADAEPDGLFSKAASSAGRLSRMAQSHGHDVKARILPPPERPAALAWLEARWEDYAASSFDGECPQLRLHTAATPFSECETVAAEILRLVRTGEYRFRDMVVASPDLESCRQTVEAVFSRYGVPCFISDKSDILQKSPVALVCTALDIVTDGWEADDLFQYLKTGLPGLSPAECDELENYCLRWNIRRFTGDAPWRMHPEGLSAAFDDESRARLARINELRARVREPLRALEKGLAGVGPCEAKARALYAFMEAVSLPQSCAARARRAWDRGDMAAGDEYRQLWDILCRALDAFVDILGEKAVDPVQFAALCRLCLAQYSVGRIPSTLDHVHVGTLDSVERRRVRCVFLIGATDDALPSSGSGGGILSDADRETLDALGMELQDSPGRRSLHERRALYGAFSAPDRLLWLSYSASGPDGGQQRSSSVLARLQTLFPAVLKTQEEDGGFRLAASGPALEYALTRRDAGARAAFAWFSARPEYQNEVWAIESQAALERGPLGEGALPAALYGDSPRLSASAVDCFFECRYRHFVRYGLRLRARRPAAFDAPEAGSYLHYVMEHTVRDVQTRWGSWAAAGLSQIQELGRLWSKRYADEVLGGLQGKNARFVYLFSRVQRTLDTLLEDLYGEFSVSLFSPRDFELDFAPEGRLGPISISLGGGVTATLSGKVDRVDGWLHDGALYLRVVDYKSGKKAFALAELWQGIGLQLPLYLFVLRERFDDYRRLHPELPEDVRGVPAGLLYAPIRSALVVATAPLSDEELAREREEQLARDGLVTDDVSVLRAMEPELSGKGRFIPVKLNADGSPAAGAKIAAAAQFDLLERHVRAMLRQMGQALRRGDNLANPRRVAGGISCDFCDYRAMCHFDPAGGRDCLRVLESLGRERFFEQLAALPREEDA